MFTIKLYRDGGYSQRILEAEGFSIIRPQGGGAEIMLHRPLGPNGEYRDERFDVSAQEPPNDQGPYYERAIIENAMGKTTEIVAISPFYKAA